MRFAVASLLILLPTLTFAEEARIKIVKSSKLNIAITGLAGGRQVSSPVTADRPPACPNSRDSRGRLSSGRVTIWFGLTEPRKRTPPMISHHVKENLGWLTGLEPATAGTTNRSSTIELQPPFRAAEITKTRAFAKGNFCPPF